MSIMFPYQHFPILWGTDHGSMLKQPIDSPRNIPNPVRMTLQTVLFDPGSTFAIFPTRKARSCKLWFYESASRKSSYTALCALYPLSTAHTRNLRQVFRIEMEKSTPNHLHCDRKNLAPYHPSHLPDTTEFWPRLLPVQLTKNIGGSYGINVWLLTICGYSKLILSFLHFLHWLIIPLARFSPCPKSDNSSQFSVLYHNVSIPTQFVMLS